MKPTIVAYDGLLRRVYFVFAAARGRSLQHLPGRLHRRQKRARLKTVQRAVTDTVKIVIRLNPIPRSRSRLVIAPVIWRKPKASRIIVHTAFGVALAVVRETLGSLR